MNAVIENLLTRRSVRSFRDQAISEEDLQLILKTAAYAPSGMGKQTWKFTAVTDRAKIQKLAAAIAQELKRENYDMYNPQVLIIPSNERESIWGKEDNACALENIFLAAHSLGIGSVWINQLDEFEIPADHVVYGMAALGYPAAEPAKEVTKKGKIQIIR